MMPFKSFEIFACDVLIIGGGGAGLRAAIEARESGANVIVVSKSRVGYGNNTFISKGTFAAATGGKDPRDNPEVHMKDSVIGGCFINDQRLLKVMTQKAGDQIDFLEKRGIKFFKRQGKIRLTHTPGHSYPRHVRGEHQTGRDYTLPLREYATRIGIQFAERIFITRIFTSRDRIAAATGITQDGRFLTFAATCIILATGGFAQAYLHNNNAAGMTGDGHALAFELGIPIKDMEFIQFYPTALGSLGQSLFLYEAFVFQAGAVMRNAQGEDIVAKHGLSDAMVMTRDRLTRVIMHEILERRDVAGGILIDLTTIPEEKLDNLLHLLPATILPDKKDLIVSPTTHFCMGGIITDENAETSIQGLFAAGEVCAGVHGANRLGGNALTEVFTMGGIAGKHAAFRAREISHPDLPEKKINEEKRRLERLLSAGEGNLSEIRQDLKKIMWFKAGIIRKKENLEEAVVRLNELTECLPRVQIKDSRGLVKYLEVCNMLLLSEMVCRAALVRTESRGAHYRSDYPEEDNNKWLKNIIIRKQDSTMNLKTVPVSLDTITL
jgi:succinate dehydrogenase/fumarate reductase flavoprotein subunit